MAGNRVEELESKVRELEATVSGLTDELVETKERLQTLEEHTELELDDVIAGGARPANGSPDDPGGPATQDDVDQAVESADPDGSGSSAGSGDDADADPDAGDESTGAVDAVEPTNETTFIDADEVDHSEEADEIGPEGSADGTNSGEPEDGGEDSDDIIVA